MWIFEMMGWALILGFAAGLGIATCLAVVALVMWVLGVKES